MAMTCVFEMEAGEFQGNPFKADTPFGKPLVISKGDLAERVNDLEDTLRIVAGLARNLPRSATTDEIERRCNEVI